ncbi:hypothetical protein [Bradyrhizobium sp. USDA 10063]
MLHLTSTQQHRNDMGAVTFTCPITKMIIQQWLDGADDASENEFRGVVCPACSQLHFINRKTGKLLGQQEK